jgi:hypothetical protein
MGNLRAHRDLTKGQIAGLKEHGISQDQFDRLDTTSQSEWKEELKLDAYQTMRKNHRKKHITSKKYY